MKKKVFEKGAAESNLTTSRSTKIINEGNLQKNIHWRRSERRSWIETFFSVFTALYFIAIFTFRFRRWDPLEQAKYVGWSAVLILLPFYRISRTFNRALPTTIRGKFQNYFLIRSHSIRAALSALALIVPVLALEIYMRENGVLLLYFSLAVFFRLIEAKFLYDTIGLCIAYTANLNGLLQYDQKHAFTATRLILWVCLFLGIFSGSVVRGISRRIWEHIRILIILRKKSEVQRLFSNFIAAAHFSPDLLEIIDTDIPKRDKGGFSSFSSIKKEKKEEFPPSTAYSKSLSEAAGNAGILFSVDEKPLLSLEKIRSFEGLERKLATVIAFKQVACEDRECCSNNQAGHTFHDLLDKISAKHNISCVRKFGDTWVGSIGFHKGYENNRKDSYHAILMGCEALLLAKKMLIPLSCAVESGRIDAGFVSCSHYDVFGPEIRWVLNMVEAKKQGHVLVGNSAKILNTRKHSFEGPGTIHFGRVIIDSIWKKKQEFEKVYSVYQLSDLVKDQDALFEEYLGPDLTVKISSYSDEKINEELYRKYEKAFEKEHEKGYEKGHEKYDKQHEKYEKGHEKGHENGLNGLKGSGNLGLGSAPMMSWQMMQGILDGNESKQVKSVADPYTWNEDIGCEMQMSVEERFGMSLDDSVLQGISGEELDLLHINIETSVKLLMVKHFFGSYLRLFLLTGPRYYAKGANDEVISGYSLNLPDKSQEFISPLEALFADIPYISSWFQEKDSTERTYDCTYGSLRDKIKKEAVAHLLPIPDLNKSGLTTPKTPGKGSNTGSNNSTVHTNAGNNQNNNTTNNNNNSNTPTPPPANVFKNQHIFNSPSFRASINAVHPTQNTDDGQYQEEKSGLDDPIAPVLTQKRVSSFTPPFTTAASLSTPVYNPTLTPPDNQDITLDSAVSRALQYKPRGSSSKYKPTECSAKDNHTGYNSDSSLFSNKRNSNKRNSKDSILRKSILFRIKSFVGFADTRVEGDVLPARGLPKYASDCRTSNYASFCGFSTVLSLLAVFLVIVDDNFTYTDRRVKASYIFGFFSLNFLIFNIAERKYDKIVCVVLIFCRCTLAMSVIPYLVKVNGMEENKDITFFQGGIFLTFGLWFPIAIRQSFLFNCVELMILIIGVTYCVVYTNQSYDLGLAACLAFPTMLILLFLFWSTEYLCVVSYVIENILVPEAQSIYQKEYIHSREILHACSPNVPLEKAKELLCPRRYRYCAMLAIHVKAADVLPGLVDVLSVASFMKEIMLLITTCVRECGLLKVTQFSGIFIAACPDLQDDNSPVNFITRTVICLRKIQSKLDAFSRRNSVNVSIGAGLSCGPVTIGLLGNSRFCFDVSGAPRDLALFMATNQNDGIFATECYGPYIRDGLSDNLVVREVTVTSAHKTMKWLQLDGAFNKGMQLDDFEYMCMLGKGGFGSVHLLWENATGKEYAIKAIPRKRGSAIPKMIQREFIILQQIQHANVVSFKCCIINKGMIYLVMSYVRGGNLKQIVERNKPDLKHLTLWFAELVLALNYIHSLGIIHRDVKPANCMIDASGHLKLADFGLSKIVTPSVSEDPTHTVPIGDVDNRNASATVAINLIKSILPLKSNMSEGEMSLPERSVQILLIDFNLMSSSAKRLREMYFKVTSVASAAEAQEAIALADFKVEIILIDLDSVNMSDPTSTMSSGVLLLQRLALTSKTIPIIGLTSIDDRDLRCRIMDAGAREVLSLPIQKAARETLLKYGRLYYHLNKSRRLKNNNPSVPPISPSKERVKDTRADRTDIDDTDRRMDRLSDRRADRRTDGSDRRTDGRDGRDSGRSPNGIEGDGQQTPDTYQPEGAATSHILPSSIANTTSFSHATYGTERTDTPNTLNDQEPTDTIDPTDPRTQFWSGQAAKHVVSEGQQKHSAVGTIHFMAPEVIFEHKYGRSVDWWACGVTFYECTVRQHLFGGIEKETIIQQIISGHIDLEPLSVHSSLLQSLVAGLLVRNPNLRLGTDGAHTIMRQDFFRGIDWNTISESDPNYKPAQHINQRHSVRDKMLFYGEVKDEPQRSRRKGSDRDREEYGGTIGKEGTGNNTGVFVSRTKKRHIKNMAMRQRKEDFQKLTDIRKSWVSGNHLTPDIEGKKTGLFGTSNMNKQVSMKGGVFVSPNGLARSGMMNSSLDWSITMLPEEESSHSGEEGKVDKDDEGEDGGDGGEEGEEGEGEGEEGGDEEEGGEGGGFEVEGGVEGVEKGKDGGVESEVQGPSEHSEIDCNSSDWERDREGVERVGKGVGEREGEGDIEKKEKEGQGQGSEGEGPSDPLQSQGGTAQEGMRERIKGGEERGGVIEVEEGGIEGKEGVKGGREGGREKGEVLIQGEEMMI